MNCHLFIGNFASNQEVILTIQLYLIRVNKSVIRIILDWFLYRNVIDFSSKPDLYKIIKVLVS